MPLGDIPKHLNAKLEARYSVAENAKTWDFFKKKNESGDFFLFHLGLEMGMVQSLLSIFGL